MSSTDLRPANSTTNVLIVGIGGQGILKTSQVLGDVMVNAGRDVKQSEVHGMSQRGGSVVSEVRFGREVHSPLMPYGQADFVVALDADEARRAEPRLKEGGRLIQVPRSLADRLDDPRSRNVAALGRLSRYLEVNAEAWHGSIRRFLPRGTIGDNIAAFDAGREFGG